jgi:hypothetical protein
MSNLYKVTQRRFIVGGVFLAVAIVISVAVVVSSSSNKSTQFYLNSGKSKHVVAQLLPPGCDRVPKAAQAECYSLSTGVTNLPAPTNLPPGFTSKEKSPSWQGATDITAPLHDVIQKFTGKPYQGVYEQIGPGGMAIVQNRAPQVCAAPIYCNGTTFVDGVPNSFILTGSWTTVIGSESYQVFGGVVTTEPNQGVVIEIEAPSTPPKVGNPSSYPGTMVWVRTTSKTDGTLSVISGSDSAGTVALQASDGANYSYNFLTQTLSAN